MKTICLAVAVASLVCVNAAYPQGRPLDWPSYGGDARRIGLGAQRYQDHQGQHQRFQLVLKRKFDKQPAGSRTLTPPVIIGLLISYKGFKELGFVAGNGGGLWAIDVDIDRMFWQKQLPARQSWFRYLRRRADRDADIDASNDVWSPTRCSSAGDAARHTCLSRTASDTCRSNGRTTGQIRWDRLWRSSPCVRGHQ